jgi:predicted phosphate transport protein (TIGR00153 family)
MIFLKKNRDFFEMFDRVGKNLLQASAHLVQFFQDTDNAAENLKTINDLEHENDLITHEIVRTLNQTFITPIDREDILALASGMDDILDLIWGAAERFYLFKIKNPTKEAAALAETIQDAVKLVYKTLTHLREKKYSYVLDVCIQIHETENRADKIFRETLGRLFEEEKDPIKVIKWKEVYENLENASDICEDVANILESIVLKNA